MDTRFGNLSEHGKVDMLAALIGMCRKNFKHLDHISDEQIMSKIMDDNPIVAAHPNKARGVIYSLPKEDILPFFNNLARLQKDLYFVEAETEVKSIVIVSILSYLQNAFHIKGLTVQIVGKILFSTNPPIYKVPKKDGTAAYGIYGQKWGEEKFMLFVKYARAVSYGYTSSFEEYQSSKPMSEMEIYHKYNEEMYFIFTTQNQQNNYRTKQGGYTTLPFGDALLVPECLVKQHAQNLTNATGILHHYRPSGVFQAKVQAVPSEPLNNNDDYGNAR